MEPTDVGLHRHATVPACTAAVWFGVVWLVAYTVACAEASFPFPCRRLCGGGAVAREGSSMDRVHLLPPDNPTLLSEVRSQLTSQPGSL